MRTINGMDIPDRIFQNYLKSLVNQFFKILPLRESGEPSLNEYMRSLQAELIGCKDVMEELAYNQMYMSLIAILQYMIDNDCEIPVVKREVFKAISICNKLQRLYYNEEV
jgi:hypothetical protein